MQKSITVNRLQSEVYDFWHNFQNLPQVMDYLETVQVNEQQIHWVLNTQKQTTIEWDTQIIQDIPNELIEWQAVIGPPFTSSGSVRFIPAPADRGIEVTLNLTFSQSDDAITKLLGGTPDLLTSKSLYYFKCLLETGEIPTLSRQPAARNDGRDE